MPARRPPLTPERARELRERYANDKVPMKTLAKEFGICHSAVSACVTGKTYADAGGPITGRSTHLRRHLTNRQAKMIREDYAEGGSTQMDIADRFGVSQYTVSSVLLGKTYADAGGPIRSPDSPRVNGRSLSPAQARQMREDYARGNVTQRELVKRYNVSETSVSNVLTGKSYVDAGGPIATAKRKPVPIKAARRVRAAAPPRGYARIACRCGASVLVGDNEPLPRSWRITAVKGPNLSSTTYACAQCAEARAA